MKSTNTEIDPTKKMQSSIKITGILLVILGIAGILLPQALSLAIEVFFASLMIIAGVLLAYHNYQNVFSSFVNWLKPLILIVGRSRYRGRKTHLRIHSNIYSLPSTITGVYHGYARTSSF